MPPPRQPPLPPEVHGLSVTRTIDGTQTTAVTKRDAARLMSWTEHKVQQVINDGRVDVCRHPETNEHLVLIDSLATLLTQE